MTDQRERQRRAWSTDATVAAYERGRPGYPDGAVDWLVSDARRVLELGAGTGKLTRSLVGRGLDVVAVEPLEAMRAHLARAVPGAEVRAGAAEEVPAGDGEFDLVVAAQAWHWFDARAAALEAARVLRPGGRLGLVWNEKDDAMAPWVAELSRLMRGGRGAADAAARVRAESGAAAIRLPAHFGPVEAAEYYVDQELDRDALIDMVSSRSYVIMMSEPDRARLLDRVRALVTDHQAGSGTVAMPYVTECYRAMRR